ncbi:lytic transglycosylase domain-containing protein [Brevibacillus sp. B_LB10_24]|uniref:lytic transglycosylase domain-containing protein n=1 Tax=Brevibacillus sp. B_LB10_24 TaxID=3380645 RepID=UPI0038B73538
MRRKRRAAVLLLLLLGVFLLINTPFIWKWMYPVKYQPEIKLAAERFNVDPMLILAVIRTESAFEPKRVSKKGAVGLMQLMPDTANWIIKQAKFQGLAMEYLDDPKVNIDIGTWYLSYLLKQFDGDKVLALAAYNAGPGSVNKWLTQEIWDGSRERVEDIPYGETRHYVQRVLYYQEKYQKIYHNDFK